MSELARIVTTTQLAAEEIAAKTTAIHGRLLRTSRHVRAGNFQAIHPEDLQALFDDYDSVFFAGEVAKAVGKTPLHFRLSRRLTSAAGKTTQRKARKVLGSPVIDYEISISTTLLFQTFHDVDRLVTATGVLCHDRLQALQRIFEHELLHLVEMLVWNDSNCAASRFQTIANRLFGHRAHTHQLITQRERAIKKFGLRVGDRVTFRFDGRHYEGIVNRVTRRATVLVEDPQGVRYTNGKRYAKFYIPLDHLRPANTANQGN
jgi:hypothetical protein